MAGEIEAYIRQAAVARGINPDVAVAVAKSEGGLNDPYRQAEAILSYGREQSYGPFQLHLPKGLGKEALAAGVDPRKDWKAGVDFALNAAAKGGWGPWFGAKKIGITGMEGIGPNAKGLTLTSNSHYNAPIGPTAEGAPMVAGVSEPSSAVVASDTPAPEEEEPQGWAAKLGKMAESKDATDLMNKITGKGDEGDGSDPARGRSSGSEAITSILPAMEGADMARAQAASSLMAQIMAKKRQRGLSLTGVPDNALI